jgi:hypothetical protein
MVALNVGSSIRKIRSDQTRILRRQLIALIAICSLAMLFPVAMFVWDWLWCHNPSSHGQGIEANKAAKEQRQKKTPDSLERDSGDDEADNLR